jgi:benzoyl-CoA reductase/2-hydroxyglutaryl-CoA dehydratase subunit BcrC/BadD/HgdB
MNKYRNIKTTVDNIVFDSRKEANYYNTLKLLKRAGEVTLIELQPEFPYNMFCTAPDIPGISMVYSKIYKYIADFRVTYKDGHVEIVDTKGFATAEFKRKQKIVEKIYGIKILLK